MRPIDIILEYYEQRNLVMPNIDEAFYFLVSEIGELADAKVHSSKKWKRNNAKERSLEDELGDTLMMLYIFASKFGLDPSICMLNKMKKGLDLDGK